MSADVLGTNCDQCLSMVQCCFTSTETVRLIRSGNPRTATSIFTQLLNSDPLPHLHPSLIRLMVSVSVEHHGRRRSLQPQNSGDV